MNGAASPLDNWLKYLAVTLGSLISVLQWQAVSQREDSGFFTTNILIFLAIASLLWEKRQTISFKSTWGSSLLGFTLILLVLLRSLGPSGYQPRMSLVIAGVGLGLLVSGYPALKRYWRELTITTLLITDPLLESLLQFLDLPLMTAGFSTAVLSALGFDAQQQGLFIVLPAGRVEVYGACSGIDSIVQMVNVAVILALILPTQAWVKYGGLGLAPILGFWVNALRVALLTWLISQSDMAAFH